MEVKTSPNTPYRTVNNKTIYFCSEACAEVLDMHPDRFLSKDNKNSKLLPFTTKSLFEDPVQVDFAIHGLHSTDAPSLKQPFELLSGVIRASINGNKGYASVIYDPASIQVADLINAIQSAGFTVDRRKLQLKITGLYCRGCPPFIVRTLQAMTGVISVSLNSSTNEVKIEYAPKIVSINMIRHAIERAGPYQAQLTLTAHEQEMDREALANEKEYLASMRKWWF